MTAETRFTKLRMTAMALLLALAVAACSSAEDDLRADLRDEGLSDDSIDCIFDAFDGAGIDVSDLGDLGPDADVSPEAGVAMAACMDDIFGELFADAFTELGEQMEDGFAEGFGDFEGDISFDDATAFEDVDLDALETACAGGDNAACDDLWVHSPFDSRQEAFAESCGGRSEEPRMGSCEFWLD